MCQLPHHAAPARFLKAIGLLALVALASALVTGLLVNIYERKAEARRGPVRLVAVGEDDTDPAHWDINWPRQYDSYKRTAEATRTRFGGHGGSEALPAQKIERDPWLRRMFLGYAFSIDYRDRRGHAYMLYDQEQTERQSKPQSGSCLHCHASIMPLYPLGAQPSAERRPRTVRSATLSPRPNSLRLFLSRASSADFGLLQRAGAALMDQLDAMAAARVAGADCRRPSSDPSPATQGAVAARFRGRGKYPRASTLRWRPPAFSTKQPSTPATCQIAAERVVGRGTKSYAKGPPLVAWQPYYLFRSY